MEEIHILQEVQALGLVRQRVLWKIPGEMPLAVAGGAGFAVDVSLPGQGCSLSNQGSEI